MLGQHALSQHTDPARRASISASFHNTLVALALIPQPVIPAVHIIVFEFADDTLRQPPTPPSASIRCQVDAGLAAELGKHAGAGAETHRERVAGA